MTPWCMEHLLAVVEPEQKRLGAFMDTLNP